MLLEGLGDMFEVDFAEMCAKYIFAQINGVLGLFMEKVVRGLIFIFLLSFVPCLHLSPFLQISENNFFVH